MQSSNGRILLSPSDLNDYVSCRHLTTLAREVARILAHRTDLVTFFDYYEVDEGRRP